MLPVQRFAITFFRMPTCRVPRPSSIIELTPGNRMISAHGASLISGLVNVGQDFHATAWIQTKIVPLIIAHPIGGQGTGRRMRRIVDPNGCGLDCGMTVKVCPDESTVPRPVILR